jgi:acyl carrier protein
MDEKAQLRARLKAQIVEVLNLEGVQPADIDDMAPLFGDEGLGLDSIDALELTLLLEREYACKIQDAEQGKQVLRSVESMAAYIEAGQK